MSLYTHHFVIQIHMVDVVQSTSVEKRVSGNVLQSCFRVNIAYMSLLWLCVAVNPDSSAISFTLSAKPDTCSLERSSRKLNKHRAWVFSGVCLQAVYKKVIVSINVSHLGAMCDGLTLLTLLAEQHQVL